MTARSMTMLHRTTEPWPTLVLSFNATLEQAYTWICAQRLERAPDALVLKPLTRILQLLFSIVLEKTHPDKTFLGCIKKGFEILSVHFGATPKISNTSLENHRSKLAQRYAQGASIAGIGDYVARWTSWCDVINPMRQTTSRQIGHMVLFKEIQNEKYYSI